MPVRRRSPPPQLAVAALLASLLTLAAAGPVQAATLVGGPEPRSQGGPWPGDITYSAGSGERNDLRTSFSGGRTAAHPSVVTFHDAGAVIHARGVCRNVTPHTARCRAPEFASASIHLGDERDVAHLGVAAFVYGGDGDDLIDASKGDYVNAVGGDGDDRLIGSPTQDDLNGGRGDDLIEGGPGSDTIVGGIGADRIACGSGSDDVARLDRADALIAENVPARSPRAFNVQTSCETIAEHTPTDGVQLRAAPVRRTRDALVVQGGTMDGAAGSITAATADGTVLATGTIGRMDADFAERRLVLTDAGRTQLQPGTTSAIYLRLEAGTTPVDPASGPGIAVLVSVPAVD